MTRIGLLVLEQKIRDVCLSKQEKSLVDSLVITIG